MTDTPELRKGTQNFRPRARLVSVLGEQLIRDATVGLLELVKNGYDAAADNVTVKLLKLAKPEDTVLIVEDDGDGMDLETILYKWLEPATGHKEEAKKADKRNRKGRLPLGEKGVGRFAAHKLGHRLTLISRSRNEQNLLNPVEVVVKINWDKFDDPEAYLDGVGVSYEERQPIHFKQHNGTRLEIYRARARWKEGDISRVSRALRRLMSPFRTPESFKVRLICPEYKKYENLDASELLKTAHAQMELLVDENGKAEYQYRFNLPPYLERTTSEANDLRTGIGEWGKNDRPSKCGGFFVTLYVWDRSENSLRLSGTNRDDLNQMNGIAVFRDGIRVMPYGEPDDDWLEIDKSRYQSTSGAFSRGNVVGAIEINQSENKDLRDKSNREGFIENEAFADFYILMKAVLKKAFNLFSEDREKIRVGEKHKRVELIPAVTRLETSVNLVEQKVEETKQLATDLVQKGKIAQELADEITNRLNQYSTGITLAVNDTRQAVTDTLVQVEEEREMLLALAGLGLAAERFTHEFARLTREASDLLQEIRRSSDIQRLSNLRTRVEALDVTLEALRDLVVALGPMFYIRRRTNEKNLDVKTIVEHALLLNQGQIRQDNIQVEILEPAGSLSVIMRRGALTQVFNNLIDNACYWLGRKSEEKDRHLKITIFAEDRSVIVADNGTGIGLRDRHRVFDIFFSTKTDGRGLGLFITREALSEAKSTIELLEPGEHPSTFRIGTAFKIQFPQEN